MARRVTLYLLLGLMAYAVVLALGVRAYSRAQVEQNYDAFGRQNAQLGAQVVRYVLDRSVSNGVFEFEDVFDTTYRPIPGSTPPAFHTEYDFYFDRNVKAIQDGFLEADAIYYAYAVTTDGYVPTSSSSELNKVKLDAPTSASGDLTKVRASVWTDADGYEYEQYAAPIVLNDRLWGEFRVGIPRARVTQEINRTVTSAILFTLLCSLILAVVIYFTVKVSLRPLSDLAALAGKVAEGDLTAELAQPQNRRKTHRLGRLLGDADEIDILQTSFGRMTANLRELIASVQEGIKNLSSSTSQISVTAKESGATAAEQASTVQQVGVTVEEIGQTSRVVVDQAQEVVEVAEQAVEGGQRGIAAVDEAMKALELVGRIIEIVETVNELAEQSNLLAVNASIEASKAGEHGKGFGVVASEVRNLAGQSKKAAKQIREILAKSEAGGKAISAASSVIEELAEVLSRSSSKARQISGAAAQQAAGISQISDAMGAVVKGGQDTASGARQLENAVASLSALASQLEDVVGRYKT